MIFWKKKYYVVSTETDKLYWNAEIKMFQPVISKECMVSSFRAGYEIDEAIEYLSKFYEEISVKHISIKNK